jgi:hypothetical protein
VSGGFADLELLAHMSLHRTCYKPKESGTFPRAPPSEKVLPPCITKWRGGARWKSKPAGAGGQGGLSGPWPWQ